MRAVRSRRAGSFVNARAPRTAAIPALTDAMSHGSYDSTAAEADYVIVGAGSAGCAMAYRLAEAGRSVVVIEHGGTDAGPFIQMPGALSIPMNSSRYDWGYETEPEPHLDGRRLAAPRGKVVGGSSSINGMVYVRGHASDFDAWREAGARGWSGADVLPYFRRMESVDGGNTPVDADWRGTDGPLHVRIPEAENPLTRAFLEAGVSAGFEWTDDYNGEKQEGFARLQQTISGGTRWSAANAYLRPAQRTGNATIVRGLARRVIIEQGRAVGVEIGRGDRVERVVARAEVVLAASAFNSPKLLMLSGIGPAAHLAEHGIEVAADRPGVGRNLMDHLEVYVQHAATEPVSLYKHMNLVSKGLIGAQWLLTRRGFGASNQFEAGAFVRSAAGVPYPDIQFHFLPVAVRYDGTAPHADHGFQAHVGPMRSAARGRVTLRSADPREAPAIAFNYMSAESDFPEFRHCVRLAREVFAQAPFDPYRGEELAPGAHAQSDDEIDAFIREHAESAYHPCGTVRMGRADDPGAVVDPECRVIGVEGLRVADSSIFPTIPYGNLNGPSIMVGEKVSDHLLGRTLPPSNREVWRNPRWETSDR